MKFFDRRRQAFGAEVRPKHGRNVELRVGAFPKAEIAQALFAAAVTGQRNSDGYTYAIASKGSPETLTNWHNGRRVLRSLANTGISVAPTASGTFPVYLRYTSQTMSGTNPDGTHYSDPGIPWISYFNGGDALHGFIRATYGWPQSLGCVEMPFPAAKLIWPSTPIGTLVSVH